MPTSSSHGSSTRQEVSIWPVNDVLFTMNTQQSNVFTAIITGVKNDNHEQYINHCVIYV